MNAFDNLRVPITTVAPNVQLLESWAPEQVWEPYWESIKGHCQNDPSCLEMLCIVMAKSKNPNLQTGQHRKLLQTWLDHYAPGFIAVYESEIMPRLNEILAPYGEIVSNLQYNKDGRGAISDRYYQMLLENKYLVVGNHHDILGHFLLFAKPDIRDFSLRQATLFASNQFLIEDFKKAGVNPQPILASWRLYTTAWNLAQEKIYFNYLLPSNTQVFSLVGAFNTVYNTIFSTELSLDQASMIANYLGLFTDHERSVLMLPQDILTKVRPLDLVPSASANDYADVVEAINGYNQIWIDLGINPESLTAIALHQDFAEIIKKSFFAFKSDPFSVRWQKFGALVNSHTIFRKLFKNDVMLKMAEGQLKIAASIDRLETHIFIAKTGRNPTRPLLH